jgi:hypothetical protein
MPLGGGKLVCIIAHPDTIIARSAALFGNPILVRNPSQKLIASFVWLALSQRLRDPDT